MKHIFSTVLVLIIIFSSRAQDQNTGEDNHAKESNTLIWDSMRPDGDTPISIMGGHSHHKGMFMFDYSVMYMSMSGMLNKTESITNDNVLSMYMVTPVKMPMIMHMLHGMYAISDRVTIMAMGHYFSSEMDHITRMGMSFKTTSNSIGDSNLSILYTMLNDNRSQLIMQLGVFLPTGSINSKDSTPMSKGKEMVLPYPMQFGSGTFNPNLALTYVKQLDQLSYGAQGKIVAPLGKNSNGYNIGGKYNFNTWAAIKTTDWLSFSARLEYVINQGISGKNPMLNPMMVPTANIENSGGKQANAALGFNILGAGIVKNMRLGVEGGIPFYQNLRGVQLANKYNVMLGVKYMIH